MKFIEKRNYATVETSIETIDIAQNLFKHLIELIKEKWAYDLENDNEIQEAFDDISNDFSYDSYILDYSWYKYDWWNLLHKTLRKEWTLPLRISNEFEYLTVNWIVFRPHITNYDDLLELITWLYIILQHQ